MLLSSGTVPGERRSAMPSWTKVRVAGPLAPYAPGFGRELRGCGYTDLSTAEQLRLMSHLSRWMAREGLDALGGEQIAAYCAARKADGYVARLTPGSLGRLLAFLRAQGVMLAALAARPPAGAEEELLGRYRAYLVEERGLVPAVVSQYLKAAALFVDGYPGAVTGQRALDAAAVSAFCVRELPRLGLRAGEVASMSLDDIAWRAGELTVHGKGGRDDRLPLPCDVGAALASYLRSRPRVTTRAVFLRATAPTGAITSAAVTWAVYNACERSGVPRAGAHRLRHSLATQMLAAGSSLTEVGQVLRHARVATTAIYAKADHRALGALALPWPGGES